VPPVSTVTLFLLTAAVVLAIPGPVTIYIVTRSLTQGKRAGFASMLGIELADLTHVTAATLGLSALVMTSVLAFSVVKYLGAAYLIYLGVRALLSADDQRATRSSRANFRRLFIQGFLVNLTNPKMTLFFFAFLPQFVDPVRGSIGSQVLLLGTMFVVLGVVVDGAYVLLAGAAGHRLQGLAAFPRRERYVRGAVYVGLGVTAAFAGHDAR
jgi:threonine/homoserine/homoserine lactone efflux protein